MPVTPDQYADFTLTYVNGGGTNGVSGTLTAADTTLYLPTGMGVRYPPVAPFRVLLGQNAYGLGEIAICTGGVSGDTLTGLTRGAEGTTPQPWAVGTAVQQSLTKGGMGNLWGPLANALSGTYNIRDYGAKIDSVTDDAAAIQAALDAANAAGGGVVYSPQGVAVVGSTLHTYIGVTIKGDGYYASVWRLKNSANVPLLETYQFSSLTGTDTQTGGVYGWSIQDLCLDGNKANNATPTPCLRIFGYGYHLHNVLVVNASGDGIYSEWSKSYGEPSVIGGITTVGSEVVADLYNVKIIYAGNNGINWYGPHDAVWFGVDSIDAHNDDGYAGFNIRRSATSVGTNLQMVNCHSTGHSWALRAEAPVLSANCQWEGAQRAQVLYTGLDSSNNAGASMMSGDIVYASGTLSAPVGIEIGSTSPSAAIQNLQIRATISGMTSGALKYTNDGGNSVIEVVVSQASGAVSTGTLSAATQVSVHTSGGVSSNITRVQSRLVSLADTPPSLGALQTGVSAQSFSGSGSGASNSVRGTISITTTGSPPGAGASVAILTFPTSFPATPIVVVQGTAGDFRVASVSTSGFTVTAGAALQVTTTYSIYYHIIG